MEWNYEGYIDSHGLPVFDTPSKKIIGPQGETIDQGVIEYWENEVEGLKQDQDALNEFYRQFPRTTKHAFRDESKDSLFNLTRIYEQIDFNEDLKNSINVTRGSFSWQNGEKDTNVIFSPNSNGRFYVTWVPDLELQNRRYNKYNTMYPGNEHVGAFGCDPYDISGTVDKRGSKGSLHGLSQLSQCQS